MANSKIFCGVPWYEININNDGSFDLCGCQNDKILGTELGQHWNIKKFPILDYWNSKRMREARLRKLGDIPDSMCKMCQNKDAIGYKSNRCKENFKSAIFADAFDRSFAQSPNYHRFKYSEDNQGATQTTPHSLHINLGDACNFACRMCNPWASSKLRQELNNLQWLNKDANFDHWTDDPQGWQNFVDFLDQSGSEIKVIHVIGGEVALMPKFDWLIDYFINRGYASDVNFSFTINGSLDYTRYFDRLAKFKRTEIGISIESVGQMGDYIRQGGNIKQILKNIEGLIQQRPDNIALVLRTVPSLLSLPDYADMINWAWTHGIPLDNSLLVNPPWQVGRLLPNGIKAQIIKDIQQVLDQVPGEYSAQLNNQKDPNKINTSIRNECESIIKYLQQPAPSDVDKLLTTCAEKLDQWDKLKRINLRDYSETLYNLLHQYGYHGA
jgi:MoaA/NifB/PqqE/SkfB family radical SAM enzyme